MNSRSINETKFRNSLLLHNHIHISKPWSANKKYKHLLTSKTERPLSPAIPPRPLSYPNLQARTVSNLV